MTKKLIHIPAGVQDLTWLPGLVDLTNQQIFLLGLACLDQAGVLASTQQEVHDLLRRSGETDRLGIED